MPVSRKPRKPYQVRRAPSERAQTPVSGSLTVPWSEALSEASTLYRCHACQTESVTVAAIAAEYDNAPGFLPSLRVTRCHGCGDVRVYAESSDAAAGAELRADLDELARLLTDCALEELRHASRC